MAIAQIDLIVCRNVFIYFSPDAITTALGTFAQALAPHGYLVTGHAELYGQDLNAFQSHLFPESVIYQRRDPHPVHSPIPLPMPVIPEPRPRPAPRVVIPVAISPVVHPPTVADLLTEAEFCLQQKNYQRSRQKIEAVLAQDGRNFAAHLLKAQLEANSGQYEAAIATCQTALKLEPLSIAIYYLMAQIAEEKGDNEGAKQLFKKIIYLEPTAILAYYELSQLYEQEGNPSRGQKMRQTALALLQQLPPQSRVDGRLDLTVQDLIEQIDPANLLSEWCSEVVRQAQFNNLYPHCFCRTFLIQGRWRESFCPSLKRYKSIAISTPLSFCDKINLGCCSNQIKQNELTLFD